MLKSFKFNAQWLYKSWFDLLFILFPPIFSTALVYILSDNLLTSGKFPLWAWVVFVLGIDVSHVYSTLFRTYFNPEEFKANKTMLIAIPVIAWVIGVMLYSISKNLFWSCLAYLAVFHFIRQQYGFMRLYSRKDNQAKISQQIDQIIIYLATLYPVIYWHSHLPRNFNWFIDGDFIMGMPLWVSDFTFVIYLAAIIIYFCKEAYITLKEKIFNLPKNLIIFGTLISWYTGIVMFNGDLVFTIINVVSHGIPYMALVWAYGQKNSSGWKDTKSQWSVFLNATFSRYGFAIFFMVLLFLAYIEEGIWDGLVWREHLQVFGPFAKLPALNDQAPMALLIPLLSLPQSTHYILDGFIWRLKDKQASWQKVLFTGKVGSV